MYTPYKTTTTTQALSARGALHARGVLELYLSRHPGDVATDEEAALETALSSHPLRDFLDPPSAACLIINTLTLGERAAKLVERAAATLDVDFLIIP